MVNVTFTADVNEPDLYNDVKDLTDPFNLNIVISITNTYSATLYFQASLVTPPEGYTNTSANLGAITAGANTIFTFSPTRAQPSLTTGEYDEELTIKIEAFTDSGYTSSAGSQTVVQDIYHFDHTDGSWTVLNHATFDSNTYDGWNVTQVASFEGGIAEPFMLTSSSYLTPFYALTSMYSVYYCNKQTFNTNSYTKARFVIHYKTTGQYGVGNLAIIMNDTLVKKSAVITAPYNRWIRYAFSVPIGTAVPIAFACIGGQSNYQSFIDEIWVIAK
jgi:hypothetical protein